MAKININIPCVIEVPDYHQFESVKEILCSFLDGKIKVSEISDEDGYLAVVYVGKKPNNSIIKKLRTNIKRINF